MIIPNQYIKLEYDPKDDILLVEWPDVFEYNSIELKHVLGSIIEVVKHYDIKKILADSIKQVVNVSNMEYAEIIGDFRTSLTTTRLQKLARLITTDQARESLVIEVADSKSTTFMVGNFKSYEEALEWLKA